MKRLESLDRLKEALKGKNIAQVARVSGVSRTVIYAAVSGRSKNLSLESFCRIAEVVMPERKSGPFLLYDAKTGLADYWYSDEKGARAAFGLYQIEQPDGEWHIFRAERV